MLPSLKHLVPVSVVIFLCLLDVYAEIFPNELDGVITTPRTARKFEDSFNADVSVAAQMSLTIMNI